MKFLFDLFPVIVFFAVYSLIGDSSQKIYYATGSAIVATVIQIAWSLIRHRKVEPMLWISFTLIVVFGGATLLLHNKTFIYWKPTALYWLFALILSGAWLLRGVNLIKKLMGEQVNLPERIWLHLLLAWALFFTAMGGLNLFVAFNFTEKAWVNFKLFGTLGLTLVFALLLGFYMMRHVIEKTGNNGDAT